MRMTFVVLLLVFVYATTPALSQIYRWVDKNGRVSFSDTPPTGIGEVVEVETTTTFKSSGLPTTETGNSNNIKAKKSTLSALPESNKVDLYVTGWCPYCKKAEIFFKSRNIKASIYDIEKDKQAYMRKQKLDGKKGVPFAVINGNKIHGYNENLYLQALHN